MRGQILDLLLELQRSLGLSFVLISHDLGVIRYFCNRIAVMYRGADRRDRAADDICFRPREAYTQALLAAVPEADPRRRNLLGGGMKITGLKTFMQRVGNRPRLLVKIETDEGIAGWGEAYNHGPDYALPPLLEYLYPQIEGIDPRRIEFIVLKLLQSSRFPPGALGLAAISAIDHALWDIAGKAAGLPVYMLLGGHVRDRVRVYCGVYTAPDPQECKDTVLSLHERYGFTAFKLSPYRQDLHAGRWGMLCETAGTWFGELRRICPAAFEFAFDAHAKIFEPYQAIQLGNALAPHRSAVLRRTDPAGAYSGLGPAAIGVESAVGDGRMPVFAIRVPLAAECRRGATSSSRISVPSAE